MNVKEKCKLYFDLFSKKNINSLSDFFSDDIILKDWEIYANGKTEVVEANKNIFDNVETINIELVCQSSINESIVFNQILIEIDSKETIRVVDVIQFNVEGLITKIEAYKG